MKALILLITGPFMLMFAIGALQTIEWNIENNKPVPCMAYIILVVVAIWCLCVAKIKKSEINDFDKL